MKRRSAVPLSEVLAVIDERIAIVGDKQKYLRSFRQANEPAGWRARKRGEFRVERLQLEGLRRSISQLGNGPRSDWRLSWSEFVRSVCSPVI